MAATCSFGSVIAHAQVIHWTSPISGNWGTENNWSPALVPDKLEHDVVIGFESAFTIQMNRVVHIGSLQLLNSAARLQIVPGRTFYLANSSILNGRIDVHDGSSNAFGTAMFFIPEQPQAMTLGGSGVISLNSKPPPSSSLYAELGVYPGSTLEIGPDITVQGNGYLHGPIILRGTIRTGAQTGGQIFIDHGLSSPIGEGKLVTDGGVISFGDREFTNLTIESKGTGRVLLNRTDYLSPAIFKNLSVTGNLTSSNQSQFGGSTDPVIQGAKILGDLIVQPQTGLQLQGSLLEVNGNIRLDSTAPSALKVSQSAEIRGSGTLDLVSPAASPDLAQILVFDGATLSLSADRTLRGSGLLSGSIVTAGNIVADEADGRMRLLTAKLKGLPGAKFIVDAGFVVLHASSIDGFDISLINGGRFEVWTPNLGGAADPTSTLRNSSLFGPLVCYSKLVLDNATIDGPVLLGPSGSARLEIEGGGARIFGDILLHSDQSAAIKFTGPVTLGGGGTIRMKAKPGESTAATLTGPSVSAATLGAEWSVEGAGQITGQFQIGGVVRAHLPASGPLRLVDASLSNSGNGEIRAEGADLFVTDSAVTGLPITAAGSARVLLVGNKASPAPAAPATFKSLSVNAPVTVTGIYGTFDNASVFGAVTIENGSSLNLKGDTNTVEGDISLIPTTATSRLLFQQSQTLNGVGVLELRAPPTAALTRAELGTVAGTQSVLPDSRSLVGNGTVSGEWTFEGIVSPGTLPSSSIGQMQIVLAPSVAGKIRRASITFGHGSTLEINIASTSSFDKITGSGTKFLDGSLVVELEPDFVPAPSRAFRIIDGTGSVSGRFSSIVSPPDFVASANYGSTFVDLRLQRVCAADLNRDDLVDASDFCDFIGAYEVMDCAADEMPMACQADLNADGVVDDADFQDFVSAYNHVLCP